jgi:hypothetical protein
MKPHRGTLILVLGILGIVACGILTGIPAWIMGNNDIKAMDAGEMDPSGRGLTQAGKITGMVSCALALIMLVIFVVAAVVGGVGAAASRN